MRDFPQFRIDTRMLIIKFIQSHRFEEITKLSSIIFVEFYKVEVFFNIERIFEGKLWKIIQFYQIFGCVFYLSSCLIFFTNCILQIKFIFQTVRASRWEIERVECHRKIFISKDMFINSRIELATRTHLFNNSIRIGTSDNQIPLIIESCSSILEEISGMLFTTKHVMHSHLTTYYIKEESLCLILLFFLVMDVLPKIFTWSRTILLIETVFKLLTLMLWREFFHDIFCSTRCFL